MKRKVEFECTSCGDKGQNRYRDTYPEATAKLQLTCCAACRQGGELPEITFLDKEGKELTNGAV